MNEEQKTELLIRIDENVKLLIKANDEAKENLVFCQTSCTSKMKEKVSWRTFALLVALFCTIIGVLYSEHKAIAAEVKRFKIGIMQCDFSEYDNKIVEATNGVQRN